MRRKKKLRATTARRPLRLAAAAAEYEEMAEPNMKLSRALLIVLVLHIVAVSGIIAFNAIKTHQENTPPAESSVPQTNLAAATTTKTESSAQRAQGAEKEAAKSRGKTATKEDRKSEHTKSTATAPSDSGKFYVVAKGDSPVTIAKKFKVSQDELLAVNHIDDPRKLQIGQKLLIPKSKTKKSDE